MDYVNSSFKKAFKQLIKAIRQGKAPIQELQAFKVLRFFRVVCITTYFCFRMSTA